MFLYGWALSLSQLRCFNFFTWLHNVMFVGWLLCPPWKDEGHVLHRCYWFLSLCVLCFVFVLVVCSVLLFVLCCCCCCFERLPDLVLGRVCVCVGLLKRSKNLYLSLPFGSDISRRGTRHSQPIPCATKLRLWIGYRSWWLRRTRNSEFTWHWWSLLKLALFAFPFLIKLLVPTQIADGIMFAWWH